MLTTKQVAYYRKYFEYIDQQIRFEGLRLDEISIVSLKRAVGGKQETCKQALAYYADLYCVNNTPLEISDDLQAAFGAVKEKVDDLLPVFMQFATLRVNSSHQSLLNEIEDKNDQIANLELLLNQEREHNAHQIALLKQDINAKNDIIENLTSDNSSLNKKASELNKLQLDTASKLNKAQDAMLKQNTEKQKEIDNLKAETASSKDTIAELLNTSAKLQREVSDKLVVVEGLQDRLRLSEDTNNTLNNKITGLNSANESLKIDLANAVNELECCNTELDKANKTIQLLRSHVDKIERDFADNSQELSLTIDDNQNLHAGIKKLTTQVESHLSNIKKLESTNHLIKVTNKQLERQIKLLEDNNKTLQMIVNQTKSGGAVSD
ncbi:hypothetical protein UA32_12445 [Photobacterium angustum]|uniref:Uncharacterized protein n=1 Tax=Photobacterium angustum TaxID=661 RepID=A0ABX5H126_PHOAN|nr:hypothetical protein [Photobacterium angustum]KJG37756.1 hypothetical protein UA32_12445 [Photobacterium angustum]PSX07023.1 hypothetical protein C0W27_15760 [Photobacterium angustum]